MIDYTIFSEMTIHELDMYLEKGEIPVRKEINGKLPKDTGFHKGKGETPIRDNSIKHVKGQDDLKPEISDIEDFLKEFDGSDIKTEGKCKKKVYEEEEDCKDHKGKCKKKLPVEPNEVDEDSEALDENFDLDAEYESLLAEEDRELERFDEELESIESFLENYKEFMED